MTKLERVCDLLGGQPDDKHYIVGTEVTINERTREIYINLGGDDLLCRLNDKTPGDNLPTVKKLATTPYHDDGERTEQDQKEYEGHKSMVHATNVLLSCGAIIMLGTPQDAFNAVLPLLKRDAGAPTDADRLTTPAGRLDGLLSYCNDAEMYEEMVFWGRNRAGAPCIFAAEPNSIIDNIAKVKKVANNPRIGIPDAEKRELVFLPRQQFVFPELFTVKTYVDGVLVDTAYNQFLFEDRRNNTLEFRQIVMIDLPVDKECTMLEGIADGDGFGRTILLPRARDLWEYFNIVFNGHNHEHGVQNLMTIVLNSGTLDLFKTVAITEPHAGGRFGKFFWDSHQPIQPLTSTVSWLAKQLFNITSGSR